MVLWNLLLVTSSYSLYDAAVGTTLRVQLTYMPRPHRVGVQR